MGNDQTSAVAALQGGQVDGVYAPTVDRFLAVRNADNVKVLPIGTSRGRVLRFRVDQEPWTDNNARLAVKMCQDRQKIMDQAYFGEGVLGHDCHVSPVHPELPPWMYRGMIPRAPKRC